MTLLVKYNPLLGVNLRKPVIRHMYPEKKTYQNFTPCAVNGHKSFMTEVTKG